MDLQALAEEHSFCCALEGTDAADMKLCQCSQVHMQSFHMCELDDVIFVMQASCMHEAGKTVIGSDIQSLSHVSLVLAETEPMIHWCS